MYIVMVATECAPVAKVGGLADVVYGLSREVEGRGHAVEIVLPKYDNMRYDQIWDLKPCFHNLWVPWGSGSIRCSIWFGHVHGRKCYFVEPHSAENFFNRGSYYGFVDEHLRMAFFSKAVLEFLFKMGKRPDVIHSHDWQTGLVPVMLYEIYEKQGMRNVRACHTIHNFMHQGVAGEDVLKLTGLGRTDYFFARERLGDDSNRSAINFLKGATVYSNFVTTVSPRYAQEVRHLHYCNGLGAALNTHQAKFGGVLNGLDYDMWNPQSDPHIAATFSSDTVEKKYINKDALRERLWLRKEYKPIIAYVGRLDAQKGVHLIRHTAFYALANGAQFVLLGSGCDRRTNDEFWQLKRQLNDHPDCHLEVGYNEELAHLVYAGADMIVVPSNFEPCGLTQMIAMRYGTVPIVRGVGGLRDTVFDRDYSDRDPSHRNGYVFYDGDFNALESALRRALGLWFDFPHQFRQLMLNGMRCDYSWNYPGRHYVNIYDYIRHK